MLKPETDLLVARIKALLGGKSRLFWIQTGSSRSGSSVEAVLLGATPSARIIALTQTGSNRTDIPSLANILGGSLVDKGDSDLFVLRLKREHVQEAINTLRTLGFSVEKL